MSTEPEDPDPSTDRLSILAPDGTVDDGRAPDLPDDLLKRMYRAMLLARRFDERRLHLQRAGEIGTFAPVNGQEAAQVGAVAALADDDWIVPAFRETAAAAWRGIPLSGILLYDAGFNEGGRIPDDVRWLPNAVPVASQLPHAAGIAYACRLRGEDTVVMAFCGDGATSEGDFAEALNFAGVFRCPVVFVVQNNQWAISTPRDRQTKAETLAQKAVAAGLPGRQVDGNDVLAVHVAAREAVERARSGDGASVIECVTYRMSVHTTADDPSVYRDDREVEKWKERDPIERLRTWLESKEILDSEAASDLDEEVRKEIEAAWSEAEETISDLEDRPLEMFEHLYSERPSYLEAQRRELAVLTGTGDALPDASESEGAGEGEGREDVEGDDG